MSTLNNIIKVTKEQYDKLRDGERVNGHAYDESALYLVEDNTDTKISAIEESVETLEASIDATDEDVAKLNEKLTEHDNEFKSLDDKYAQVSHNHDVSNINGAPNSPENDEFFVIGSSGGGTPSQWIDLTDTENYSLPYAKKSLETDVSDLTTRVGTAEGNITDIKIDLVGYDNKIGAIEESVSEATNTVGNLETSVNSISTTMSSLGNSINTLNVEVEVLQNTKADKSGVENVQKEIDELEKDLSNLTEEVACKHTVEITGNTGDEHGLAIEDQQLLIPRIQGQTLAVNQLVSKLVSTTSGSGVSYTNNGGGSLTLNGTNTNSNTTSTNILNPARLNLIVGHKYILLGLPKQCDNNGRYLYMAYQDSSYGYVGEQLLYFGRQIFTPTKSNTVYGVLAVYTNSGATWTNAVFKPQIVDLTQMFGVGNEPTTIDEFYSRYNQGYIPYNKGTFAHSQNNLISTGRNLWDEEVESGQIISNGTNAPSTTTIRSKNYCPIVGGKQYYFQTDFVAISTDQKQMAFFYYDANKDFISRVYQTINSVFTAPINACYFKIGLSAYYGTTYNNDICINVSDTSFNGTYEPYKEEIISNVGELKALDYIDNVRGKKVYATELYTITNDISFGYNVDGNYKSFYIQNTNTNFKYLSTTTTYIDKFINTSPYISYVYAQKNGVIIIQTNKNYATKAEFLADMVGVQIMSESAAPIEEDVALPAGYGVYKNGYQIQDGEVPYVLTKKYSVSTKAQILANIETDRQQQKQLNSLDNKIVDVDKNTNDLLDEINEIRSELQVNTICIDGVGKSLLDLISEDNLNTTITITYNSFIAEYGEELAHALLNYNTIYYEEDDLNRDYAKIDIYKKFENNQKDTFIYCLITSSSYYNGRAVDCKIIWESGDHLVFDFLLPNSLTKSKPVLQADLNNALGFITTPPTSANTTGQLKVVVLDSSQHSTATTDRYDGYLYIYY